MLHEVDPTLRTMGQQKVSTNLGTKQIIGATLLFSLFFFLGRFFPVFISSVSIAAVTEKFLPANLTIAFCRNQFCVSVCGLCQKMGCCVLMRKKKE